MMRIPPIWIGTALGAAALALALFYVRDLRRRWTWLALLGLTARLAALGVLGALLTLIFAPRKDTAAAQGAAPPVWVLQDVSLSMDLPEGETTRARLAESVVESLKKEARNVKPPREVRRLLFARETLPEDDRVRPDRGETRLGPALEKLLTEPELGGVLVVSDGAFTDGLASPLVLRRLRHRGVPVMAACPLLEDGRRVDAALRNVQVSPVNPRRVAVTAAVTGVDELALAVSLKLDGKAAGERTPLVRGDERVAFDLSELAQGWHELELRVPEVPGDICPANNVRRAVFECVRGNKILFVHGRPNREDAQLGQLLAKRYGTRLEGYSVFQPPETPPAAGEVAMVVIGDVAPEQLPPDLARLLVADGVRVLFTGARRLEAWRGSGSGQVPEFPVAPAADDAAPAGDFSIVEPAGAPAGPQGALKLPVGVNRLGLALVQNAELAPGAAAVVAAEGAGGRRPLLAVDRPEKPRVAVSLAPATWKWAMDPDPAVREGYQLYWTAVIDWLGRPEQSGFDLELDVTGPQPEKGDVTLRVRPVKPLPAPARPPECVVKVECGGKKSAVVAAWDARAGVYTGSYSCPPTGEVVWFEALARVGGKEWLSPRRPALWDHDEKELADTRPRPDLLAALVADGRQDLAWYGQRDALARRLFDAGRGLPLYRPPERRHELEALLAGIVLLLTGFEWWIERRKRDG